MSRKILERLATTTLVALRCKGEAWGGSLFARTLVPDGWMGLVLKPDGARKFVPAGEDPAPDRDDTLALVRNRALTITWTGQDLPASDGHPVSVDIGLLVRCPAREDDLAALRQTLLAEPELELARLTDVVIAAGLPGLVREFVRTRPANELVYGDARDALLSCLRAGLQHALFSAGLVLEQLGALTLRSESLTAHDALQRRTARRVQELEARELVERAARAATHRRLDDLGDILGKLKSAAETDGALHWRELLPSLTPGERGRLLENLWRLTPDRKVAEALVAVTRRECIWLDPAEPQRIMCRIEMPEELGDIRSATFDARTGTLLIGVALGVWQLGAASGEVVARFAVPGAEVPQGGFNAAVTSRGQLFATHSQLGAWSWTLDEPMDAQALLRPIEGVPRTIRAVTVDERGRVLLAADERVHAFDLAGETGWQTPAVPGRIQSLTALEEWVFAGTSAGALLRSDLNLRDGWTPIHRTTGPIESIGARRWDDLVELVIPAGGDGVYGVYAQEGIVSRLLDARASVRRVWACDDLLVGLTASRDRLVVLNGTMPARTGVPVELAKLTGRSIQDACIVVRDQAAPQKIKGGSGT